LNPPTSYEFLQQKRNLRMKTRYHKICQQDIYPHFTKNLINPKTKTRNLYEQVLATQSQQPKNKQASTRQY
jgi:hypothetical protein